MWFDLNVRCNITLSTCWILVKSKEKTIYVSSWRIELVPNTMRNLYSQGRIGGRYISIWTWFAMTVQSFASLLWHFGLQVSKGKWVYGIQINRSETLIDTQFTFDTCSEKKQKKLANLWAVIVKHFQINVSAINSLYVLLVPHSMWNKFNPPRGHKNDFSLASPKIQLVDKNCVASHI